MTALELLSPARNKDIGIAAIDCGADAVYIAGPDFGARKAAGNSFEDIAELCSYAHRFGARVYVTFNILIHDDEWEELHTQMRAAQDAGADAFIIREEQICDWDDIRVPLHASTQCAIRDADRARQLEAAGCSRIVLEREMTLEKIREISRSVDCEIEFFVHGALCVCYSGECRLSEHIDGRSADRGECIQACRSLYDLEDASGRKIVRDKALLSLKDYRLKERIEDLAQAGVCSFKIEGRLKNASYVRNVVRDYDLALNELVTKYPEKYRRASFGQVRGGFQPDTDKTFNRGYTELWIDGKRGQWSSMNAPKSMGEEIGRVIDIRSKDRSCSLVSIQPTKRGIVLHNGDGFAFSTREGVTGFRGDVCTDNTIMCKNVPGLRKGTLLFRNISAGFEKELEANPCKREMAVSLDVRIYGKYSIEVNARTEDGRMLTSPFHSDLETAENRERAESMLREQLSKRCGIYNFKLDKLRIETAGGKLPLLSAATINGIRRLVASDLDMLPVQAIPIAQGKRAADFQLHPYQSAKGREDELMRSRYCIRYELGLCPRYHADKTAGPLFLVNNGQRFTLGFDCSNCEMTVKAEGR